MAEDKLTIEGVDQFQSATRAIQKALPTDLKKAAQQIAKDWISAARNKAGPHAKDPAAALTIGNDPDGAVITNDHPLFYGEEFGGQARPATMMFPPHLGQTGYWFYPAARANADKFQKIWEAAIDDATKPWDHKG